MDVPNPKPLIQACLKAPALGWCGRQWETQRSPSSVYRRARCRDPRLLLACWGAPEWMEGGEARERGTCVFSQAGVAIQECHSVSSKVLPSASAGEAHPWLTCWERCRAGTRSRIKRRAGQERPSKGPACMAGGWKGLKQASSQPERPLRHPLWSAQSPPQERTSTAPLHSPGM